MNISYILCQLLIGLIIGVIARFLMPGKENLPAGFLGIIITVLVGMAGAGIGGWIGQRFFAAGENYVVGWVMSIVGAILLLIVVRLIFGRGK